MVIKGGGVAVRLSAMRRPNLERGGACGLHGLCRCALAGQFSVGFSNSLGHGPLWQFFNQLAAFAVGGGFWRILRCGFVVSGFGSVLCNAAAGFGFRFIVVSGFWAAALAAFRLADGLFLSAEPNYGRFGVGFAGFAWLGLGPAGQ